MYRQLLQRSAQTCDAMGGRVLPRLQADPRLKDAAAALQAGQDGLQAKALAYHNAVEALRTAGAVRDQALRDMEDRLREFALNLLSVVRNNHGADTYLRYFPLGYGSALREKPEQIPEITRAVLGKLAEETDPWLVSFPDRITAAHDAFAAAQDLYVAAVGRRNDARSYLQAEKRLWIQALSVSRLRAREAYLDDEPYVRAIFAPAQIARRAAASAVTEGDTVAETPADVDVPVVPSPVSPSAPVRPAACGVGLQVVGPAGGLTKSRSVALPPQTSGTMVPDRSERGERGPGAVVLPTRRVDGGAAPHRVSRFPGEKGFQHRWSDMRVQARRLRS